MERLKQWSPRVLSVLRFVAAILFIEHGTMKLFHFPQAVSGLSGPLPPAFIVAGLLELVGGGLLAVEFMTRAVAFLLSGEIAVVYFLGHAVRGFYPVLNGGEASVLYCFVFFYLVFAGSGAWSVDSLFSAQDRIPRE